jgi:hypothetical protein
MTSELQSRHMRYPNIMYSISEENPGIEISYCSPFTEDETEEEIIFLVDLYYFLEILNTKKQFVLDNTSIYSYYKSNNKKITILETIYNLDYNTSDYVFLNGNKYDLRKCNVEIYHKYHKIMKEKYPDCEYIQGHYNKYGIDANLIKNPIWKIKENDKDIYLMYCEKDTICKLCEESYKKIKDIERLNKTYITWYKCENGYIAGKLDKTQLYIHQIIMDCYGNGRGTSNVSVDHIDRDPLNNSINNLRIATREDQENNSKGIAPNTKRARQSTARQLPDGITQDMMKKYVVYYVNVLDKNTNKTREYFRVEGHPKQNKKWETTKSGKISIIEKLNMANKKVEEFDNFIK